MDWEAMEKDAMAKKVACDDDEHTDHEVVAQLESLSFKLCYVIDLQHYGLRVTSSQLYSVNHNTLPIFVIIFERYYNCNHGRCCL